MTESAQAGPQAVRIVTGHDPDRTVSVKSIQFNSGGLCITMASDLWVADAVFECLWGFRVLSELDLAEFWPKVTLKDGWLFEVHSGGWLDLELSRPHFASGRLYELREYLVVGVSDCVSVLAEQPPEVRGTPSDSSFKPNPLRGQA
ncbi:hypothetical protein GGR77_003681 [Xanthomonas translucens]